MRYCRQNPFVGAPIWCSCAISRQTGLLLQILFLASKRVPSLIDAGFEVPRSRLPPCFGTQNQGLTTTKARALAAKRTGEQAPVTLPRAVGLRKFGRYGPAIPSRSVQKTSGCPSSRTRICRLTPFCSASSRSQRGGSSRSSKDSLNVPKCIGTNHSAPRSRNTFNASSGPM